MNPDGRRGTILDARRSGGSGAWLVTILYPSGYTGRARTDRFIAPGTPIVLRDGVVVLA
jgi:hypothetical protein